jgi:sulfhydrogenase subunit beta (sulfur reductase)
MSGSGMTGENVFQGSNLLIPKASFFTFIDSLRSQYRVLGPVKERNHAVFREITSSVDLFMDYRTTMLSPGKMFIYRPREDILKFKMELPISIEEVEPVSEKQVIVGIHPCDINAIRYLDRTFLGSYVDTFYKTRRENTILIGLNCTQVSGNCFCSSVGSGPFLKAQSGYDMLLTDFGENYLVELKSKEAHELFPVRGKEAGPDEWRIKSEKEESLVKSFKKTIYVDGLDNLFMKNLDHPVWATTANERCLSCSNCVMVCPTCFCYDLKDEVSMDLKEIKRIRQLDACQDFRFSEVHGGNFRVRRASRLRQWVIHNLNYTGQYDTIKTVGCGRCITWCPTNIDLTEMAKEIQRSTIR